MEDIKKDFRASSMLVVYTDDEDYYLETHEIFDGKVQQAKPLSLKAIKKLHEVFKKTTKNKMPAIKGIVPKGLLYVDTNIVSPILIWYRAPKERKLYFKNKDSEEKTLSGVVQLPGIIFCLKDEDLHIVCVTGEPTMKSKLYYAPFPNTHDSNSVCMGNVKMRHDTEDLQEIIGGVESAFFNSRFNHVHHSAKNCKVDIMTMWKEQIADKKKPFDVNVLVELNTNLEDFIDEQSN